MSEQQNQSNPEGEVSEALAAYNEMVDMPLIGVPDDELVMVPCAAVRQTINGVYIDSTVEVVGEDYPNMPAYVCPVSDQKKIRAIVAVPEGYRMSVIPYGMAFDWLVELRFYDTITTYEDGLSAPTIGGDRRVL